MRNKNFIENLHSAIIVIVLCGIFLFLQSENIYAQCQVEITGTPPTCGNCDGSAIATPSGGTAPYTYSWSTGGTAESIGTGDAEGTHLCLDAGNTTTQIIASTGDTFKIDNYYTPGNPATVVYANNTVADILNTTDDIIYRNERNIVAAGGTMTYKIPVINGSYDVELHFAELFFGVAGGQTVNPNPTTFPNWPNGMRKFDVSVEGSQVLNDYDINADVGPATAVIKTFSTTVSDDTLNIAFTSVVNRAKVNAICVKSTLASGGDGLCEGNYSVTITDDNGCTATAAVSLTEPSCDDNDLCTTDLCDNGTCTHTPVDCNDNNACTIDDCEAATGCINAPIDCDDSNECTDDYCSSGFCVNDWFSHDSGPCSSDDDPCTADICDENICEHNPISCDDFNDCTIDYCDATLGCVNLQLDCNDFNECTDDYCSGGFCFNDWFFHDLQPCSSDGDPCTEDICDEDVCEHNLLNCDDFNDCTIDNCDEILGCVNAPITCDDNNECTDDYCFGGLCYYDWFSHDQQPCSTDGDACTQDICDEDQCTHTPLSCDDLNSCTFDFCIPFIGCINSPIDCNDFNECTDDYCSGGFCVNDWFSHDQQPCSSDGNACTEDICDEDMCEHNLISCNDLDDCTTDACESANGCVYTPMVCDDSDPCTNDACASGRCSFRAIDCDDLNSCTNDYCLGGICYNDNICNPCTLEVISFTLVNSLTDIDIGPLSDGDIINLFNTPNINIRANLCVEPVGSVKFNLNGPTFRIENIMPYALAGDAPPANYNKWNAAVGTYVLTAIPYSGSHASGTQGTAKTITIHLINQQPGCTTNAECNDSDACTNDICQSAQCLHTPVSCNDNSACTDDLCFGGCVNIPVICDDSNPCTSDGCDNISGCYFNTIAGCCLNNGDCNDNDICTADACVNNACEYTLQNNPTYLHVVNTTTSWKKLKLGYSPTSVFTPAQNVIAGGNTMMCVTLRGNVGTNWNKVQIRPQGSLSSPVSLGSYGLGTSFMEICIPLASFGGSVDFTKLTLIEIPYSNGAGPFEIDIQRIEFRGGATPFLWFGGSKTDNKHDGNTPSTLAATLVSGSPCGSTKLSAGEVSIADSDNGLTLNAYPNPFSHEVNIEFMLATDSRARLEMVTIDGKLVNLVFDGNAKANEMHTYRIEAENLADGMYFYRLITENGEMHNRKLMLLK